MKRRPAGGERPGHTGNGRGSSSAGHELRVLADEQAALRRVATLVARGTRPEQVFSAVVEEIGLLFGADLASMGRYESDGALVFVASWGKAHEYFPVGSRRMLGGSNLATMVLETGRTARIDDYGSRSSGSIGVTAREAGINSSLAAPIMVEGRLWGVMAAGSTREHPLPADTEARLGSFTELVATAIANAESREALGRIVEEQAALRRVATLVATGSTADQLFDRVASEMGRVLQVPTLTLNRYDPDGWSTVLAEWGESVFSVGSRWPLDGESLASIVHATGLPHRIDDYSRLAGTIAESTRADGFVSTVGVPIVVEGGVWGLVSAGTRDQPLAAGTETRLEQFTELVATAISNAESHETRTQLTDVQSALRRVATLAAAGSPRMEVFGAVAEEIGRLLSVDNAYVTRLDGDGKVTVLAGWISSGETVPCDLPRRLEEGPIARQLRKSGGPVRLDPYPGQPGVGALEADLRSAVSAPITVEGNVWGFVTAASATDQPPPPATEERLTSFTELLGSAIADAESRESVARLADDQAALRRVATLVARGVAPAEIFSAVSDEVGGLFGTDRAAVAKFEHDGPAIVVVGAGEGMEKIFPSGSRWEMDELFASTRVFHTGRPARMELNSLPSASAPVADLLRRSGVVSTVASPIVVGGGLWGAITVSTTDEPLPGDTEERLGKFTELVATAIANALSGEALEQLAGEQAALRRMATLVARGVEPQQIFSAVSTEVGRLVGSDTAAVVRFEHDPPAIVVVGVGDAIPGIPVGTRSELDDALASTTVYWTGRSSRIDARDWASAKGPLYEPAREVGLTSTVASPILVEGRLWGTISVSGQRPMAADTEQRLERFADLVATAIANAASRSELAASRRRIVAASDETRRRIERDLHDGMQQRLVSLALALRAAEARTPAGEELHAEIAAVAGGLTEAVQELQELSRGIHPAILSQGGLGPALRTLARRAGIPVDLDIAADARLGEPIEVAAYYVASEALANATKHAQATRVEVVIAMRDGAVVLSIRDDGVGGADIGGGTGLVGLSDRVEALGGSFRVASRLGEGTEVIAELPLDVDVESSDPSE
jgi:GAF domain-containing protein